MKSRKFERKSDKILFAMIKTTTKTLMIALALFLVSGLPVFSHLPVAKAALLLTTDYTRETVSVTSDAGSSKFYMSYDNKKSWELIDAGSVDISPYLTTKEVILYFKGNKDAETQLKLPAEDSKTLTVAYKVTAGVGSIVYTSTAPVQYRNGTNGIWITATGSPIYTAMYEIKGATLYFRTAATNTVRAGKIVTVKVPKRPTAPSIKIDYSKLAFTGVKASITKYRVGDDPAWKVVNVATGGNLISLSDLVGGSVASDIAITGGTVEFRFDGDDKKVTSSAMVITVPAQVTLADSGIALSGTSLTGITLTISDTDKTKSYEYTKVPLGGGSLDMTKAKWTSIPSKNTVLIKGAAVGDTICVRVKSRTDSTTKQVYLPSTYVKKTVTS